MTLKNLLISLLLIIFVFGAYKIFLDVKSGKIKLARTSNTEQKDTPKEKTEEVTGPKIVNEVKNYKLPSGIQVYNMSHGEKVVGPRAEKISYDPLSIVAGQAQTITVTFPVKEQVSSAILFITTDNLEDQKLTLEKVPETPGLWAGTWSPTDTINSRYNVRLYFVGPTGTYNTVSTFL